MLRRFLGDDPAGLDGIGSDGENNGGGDVMYSISGAGGGGIVTVDRTRMGENGTAFVIDGPAPPDDEGAGGGGIVDH